MDFVKKEDTAFGLQLKHFADKLPTYASVLGITTAEVASAKADADYFNWTLAGQTAYAQRSKDWTAYKDLLRSSGNSAATLGATPVAPVLPTAVPAVSANIEWRFRQMVRRIKGSTSYTEAIGRDLDIIASTENADYTNVKPVLKIELVAGQPHIIWKKNGLDGIEIWKDNGSGNFNLLVFDMRPNHLDNSALPEIGQSIVWRYKAIYRKNDQRVGNWSDEISITVMGHV